MLEWVGPFIQLCQAAIATGKTIKSVAESALTEKEKELLRSAAEQGIFILSYADQCGRFVFTYKDKFIDTDPAVTAAYLDAFMRLCDRGLIGHERDKTFRLTGQGFELARKLASEVQ